MAKLAIKKASTDVTTYVFIQDSSKTTGVGLAGLAYNTGSLVGYYVRPKGSATAITLATQTVTGDHSDGGFVEIDATNMPGVYRLDLPDAVCATGVPSVVVMLKGATNMSPVVLEIQLTDFDLNTAAITAAGIADAVWDEATADHTTASSFGGKNQKVVPSETINDYKADVSALTNVTLAATQTGVTIPTVTTVGTTTNLTNLPTMPTDWLTAAGLKADAVTEIQSGLATAAALTTVDANVDSILADTGTDGVKLASTQGAITWAQQKIVADVDGQGALDIQNTNDNGFGKLAFGGLVGEYNYGIAMAGVFNQSAEGIGLKNVGEAQNVEGFDPAQATEATLTAIQADLDNPDQYKADVSALTNVTLTAAYDKAKDDVLTPLAVVDGVVDAIKVQTDKIPASPASAGEYTTAIAAIPTTPLLAANYTAPDNASIAAILADTGTDGVVLKAAGLNADAVAEIADGVWDEATADHTTAGSTGVALTDILTDTSTTLDNKLDIIDVVADTIYAEMGSSAEVADVVWDELLAGHVIGGSAGEKIAAIKAKTDLMNASAITYTPTVSGTTITLRRGDTLSAPLTDTGALTGYVSIDFTVKRRMSDLDDDAIIRIRKNASGTNDGLLRLNAAAPTSSALGSIIVNDVTTGDITITLDETATDDLDTRSYLYDVQLIDTDSVLTLTYGKLSVVADVTRAVS